MAISDYIPDFSGGNLSSYYRSVLGVPVRKRIVIAVAAVFGLLLIFVCGLILAKAENRPKSKIGTHSLVHIPFKSAINVSVDPCTNFYEFTCGLWSKNEAVLRNTDYHITSFDLWQKYFDEIKRVVFENSQVSSDLPRVVNDAIRFFNLCASGNSDQQSDLNYLESYFKLILGGWPVLHPNEWDDSKFDWIRASAYLMKTLGIESIFGLYSIADDNNISRSILFMKPPDLRNEGYTQFDTTSPQMIYSILLTLNSFHPNYSSDNIDSILKSEAHWWKLFSELPAKPERFRTTVKELKEKLPDFDWMYYYRMVMNDTLVELGKEILEEDIVLVENFKFIENAVRFFKSGTLTKTEIADLFGWLVMRKIWLLIPGVFQKYAEIFGYDASEFREETRNKCFETLFELYESSVDYLFVRNSSHSCVSDGEVLVHYLKNSLEDRLYSSDWLDNSTKEAALRKLKSMQSVNGFRSYLNNKTEFNKIFDPLPSIKPSLLQTYFEIKLYFLSCLVSVLKADDKPSYIMPRSVTSVGAYYDTQRNTFTIPLSIYNPPFYHSHGPWYLNFGALGALIGHEIMHGFDKVGCQRGETGSFKKWWSNSSAEIYEQRAECFVDQYSSYLDFSFKSKSIDRTIDEDVADSEGLRLAYLAYLRWVEDNGKEQTYSLFNQDYSAEQMFFISYGSVWCSKIDPESQVRLLRDPHSFPKWRVNGAVSNSEFFSRSFHCPKGSLMNPDKKCEIW